MSVLLSDCIREIVAITSLAIASDTNVGWPFKRSTTFSNQRKLFVWEGEKGKTCFGAQRAEEGESYLFRNTARYQDVREA